MEKSTLCKRKAGGQMDVLHWCMLVLVGQLFLGKGKLIVLETEKGASWFVCVCV